MNDQYERLNLNDFIYSHPERDLLTKILQTPGTVSDLLRDGCYIAGGFGRALMRGDSIADYLRPPSAGVDVHPAGDIDIFFEDKSKTEAYKSRFDQSFRSFGGNALEISMNRTRVQLVDSERLVLPMEEQLQQFDFTNSCVGITASHIFVHSRFKEIESNRLLDVKNNASPFMGGRIIKYFKHRGISGVTPGSEPLITEWIMRALCDDFDKSRQLHVSDAGINHNILALLREKNLTRPDDLLLVLGKFKQTVSMEYGSVRTVDFALTQLKERGYEVTVPGL